MLSLKYKDDLTANNPYSPELSPKDLLFIILVLWCVYGSSTCINRLCYISLCQFHNIKFIMQLNPDR